jgi:hypothetical protein
MDLEVTKEDSIPGIVEVLVGKVFSTGGDYEQVAHYNAKIIDLEKFHSAIDSFASSRDEKVRRAVTRYLSAEKNEKD